MSYRTIFAALAMTMAVILGTIMLEHASIPRWQGWIAMGSVLLVVSLLGLGHSRGIPRTT